MSNLLILLFMLSNLVQLIPENFRANFKHLKLQLKTARMEDVDQKFA